MSKSGATGIGKAIGMMPKTVNKILSQMGYIMKDKFGNWILTELGKKKGGTYSQQTNYPVPTFDLENICLDIAEFLKQK